MLTIWPSPSLVPSSFPGNAVPAVTRPSSMPKRHRPVVISDYLRGRRLIHLYHWWFDLGAISSLLHITMHCHGSLLGLDSVPYATSRYVGSQVVVLCLRARWGQSISLTSPPLDFHHYSRRSLCASPETSKHHPPFRTEDDLVNGIVPCSA